MAARRSLRVELIASLAVLLMMAAVSLSLATELLGRQRHIEQEKARLVDHATALATVVSPLVGGSTASGTSAAVEQVLRASVGTLGIVAIEVYRAGERPSAMVTLGLPPTLGPPTDAAERATTETTDGYFVVDEPIRTFGPAARRVPLVLRVSAQTTPWTRVGDWQQIAILAGGVGAVLLLLGGLLVEAQVLRPLRAVRNAAQQVEVGNLQARVPEDGPAEVRELAEAFNTMTASLSRQVEENERQRQRLVRSEQLATVGRVAAGMAHEVGNPLAAILGYVELLLDPRSEPAPSEEQSQLLQRMRVQLERIQHTLGQLLDLSRPSKGVLGLVPLRPALRRLLSMTRHDPRCKDVEIEAEGDTELSAWADEALLDQVVQNLVVNAARAARSVDDDIAPRVVLSITPDGSDHVRIDVVDNGPGVPEADRERLFEPFFTTAKAGEGTGLGLAISRSLVEGMDGELRHVQSGVNPAQSPGRPGATFRIRLPTHPPNSPDSADARPTNAPENDDV